jgi:hypothetical protein
MDAPTPDSLHPEALESNRRGELTDTQRRNLGTLSRGRRGGALQSAALLGAGALVIFFFASPTTSHLVRVAVPIGCLAIAVFLLVRSFTGGDALTRDLRSSRVATLEGPVGKARLGTQSGPDIHYLEIGDRKFQIAPATYAAAPEAGYVRVYFLPLSGKVVNFERLPNPTGIATSDTRDVLKSLGTAIFSTDMRKSNEARARIEALGDTLKTMMPHETAPPPLATREPRQLAAALIGSWSSSLMHLVFATDGTVTVNMLGRQRTGHWSIDGDGRLRSDITGQPQIAEAWVSDDQLTVTLDGKGLIFTREAGA